MIIIDPGHGGEDPGAVGPTGSKEKDVVLSTSKCLKKLLEWLDYQVRLTREKDIKPSWLDRVESSPDDIFISIHCNAASDESIYGTETFHYTESDEGKRLARAVHQELIKIDTRNRKMKHNQEFYVLRKTICPAVLIETDFISNPEMEKKLASQRYQMKLAAGIAAGIDLYYEEG